MEPSPPPGLLIRVALVIYLPMAAALYFVSPRSMLQFSLENKMLTGLGAALVLVGVIVGGSRYVSRHTEWGKALHREMAAMLGNLNEKEILLLALLSAVGEEALFRGLMLPRLGLLGSSVVFALFHFPFKRTLVPWTLFALVLGLVLGALVNFSGSLWPAVLVHFGVNHLNLHDLMDHDTGKGETPENF